MSEFVEHILEVLEPCGTIRAKRMFGGYGLYRDELFFGLVADDVLYLKTDDQSVAIFLDRRIDPGTPITLTVRDRPVEELLSEIAKGAGAEMTTLGPVVYLGPSQTTSQLATLAALRRMRVSPLSEWHERSAARDVVLAVTRAERELGWRPTRSSAGALCDAYDWYLANRDRARAAAGLTHRAAWDERALGLLRRVS